LKPRIYNEMVGKMKDVFILFFLMLRMTFSVDIYLWHSRAEYISPALPLCLLPNSRGRCICADAVLFGLLFVCYRRVRELF